MKFNPVTGNNDIINKQDDISSYTVKITSSMDRETADINIVVLSDSTGDSPGEWADLLCFYLASLYPKYSVKEYFWNTGTLVYNSPSIIQTGTGARTLNFYIGGASGSQISYPLTNLTNIIPIIPDLVIISYGHNNNNPSIYRNLYLATSKAIQRKFPAASIICIMQNPKAVGVSGYQNQLDNAMIIQGIAASEGYGCINVMQAFIDYGDYATDLLNNVDGIHPNSTGSAFWLNVVKPFFIPKSYAKPEGPRQQIDRIFVPAPSFFASEGSPNLTVYTPGSFGSGHGGIVGYAMDASTLESISSYISIPEWWQTINVYVYWVTNSNNPGNVSWIFSQGALDETATGVGSTTAVTQTGTGNAVAYGVAKTTVRGYSGNTWTPTKPTYPTLFHIIRDATNVLDTCTIDVIVTGVLFERVT